MNTSRDRTRALARWLLGGVLALASWTVFAEFQLPPASELEGDDGAELVAEEQEPEEEGGRPAISNELFPRESIFPSWVEDNLDSLRGLLLPIPVPGEDWPGMGFEEFDPLPEFVSEPAYGLPSAASLGVPMASSLAIPVSAFTFEGNTAFTDAELAAVVDSFLAKKNLTSDDLQSARLALTEFYINGGQQAEVEEVAGVDGRAPQVADGYISSGAVLPDQNPLENGGIVAFKIIEGELTRITISWAKTDADGNAIPARRTLRDRFLKPRIKRGAENPLHMGRMREQLQLLQQNPNIGRINAELKPDAEPGESYLDVKIEPAQMFHAGVDFHNARSPSVGPEQLDLWLEHTSLTGHSDRLALRYGLLEQGIEGGEFSGDTNIEVDYSLPITYSGTLLDLAFWNNGYAVIEEPFVPLSIEGRTETYMIGLRHPLVETGRDRFSLGLHFEKRHTETSLLGQPFSLTPGALDGEIDLSVLRFSQDWSRRDTHDIIALRSVFSIGLDAFDATENGTDRDAEFFAWLGQAQYVRRFVIPGTDYEFQGVVRSNLQLTNSPLLAPEQYSIGGIDSVRGYRENQLVRDMGYQGTLELRLPVWVGERSRLNIVPFVDVGGGWNHVEDGIDNAHQTIASVGVGLQAGIGDRLEASIYWGHGFTEFDPVPGADDLQDSGVHFLVSWRAF